MSWFVWIFSSQLWPVIVLSVSLIYYFYSARHTSNRARSRQNTPGSASARAGSAVPSDPALGDSAAGGGTAVQQSLSVPWRNDKFHSCEVDDWERRQSAPSIQVNELPFDSLRSSTFPSDDQCELISFSKSFLRDYPFLGVP